MINLGDLMGITAHDPDPYLSSEEVESLRWIALLGRRQDVSCAHFETLVKAGYITKSIIDPVTPRGLKRLARESRRIEAPAARPAFPRSWAWLRWGRSPKPTGRLR